MWYDNVYFMSGCSIAQCIYMHSSNQIIQRNQVSLVVRE